MCSPPTTHSSLSRSWARHRGCAGLAILGTQVLQLTEQRAGPIPQLCRHAGLAVYSTWRSPAHSHPTLLKAAAATLALLVMARDPLSGLQTTCGSSGRAVPGAESTGWKASSPSGQALVHPPGKVSGTWLEPEGRSTGMHTLCPAALWQVADKERGAAHLPSAQGSDRKDEGPSKARPEGSAEGDEK